MRIVFEVQVFPKRGEICGGCDEIGSEFFGVTFTQGSVVAAQYNFRTRPEVADVFYNFGDALVPVGHCCLDEDEVGGFLFGEKIGEYFSRQGEPFIVTTNMVETGGLGDFLMIEMALAPPVRFELLPICHKLPMPVEIIEDGEVGLSTKEPGCTQHTIRL